jgi:hypothetical protein
LDGFCFVDTDFLGLVEIEASDERVEEFDVGFISIESLISIVFTLFSKISLTAFGF